MSDKCKKVTFEVVTGAHGSVALYANNHRIAGGKPWGGGRTVYSFEVDVSEIRSAGIITADRSDKATVKESQKVDAAVAKALEEAGRDEHP